MAYPGDLSNPAPAAAAGLMKSARLTADDLEQLAAAFRPSWELDDAPFTGAGSIAPADLHALQGSGGTHADIRAAAQAPITRAPAAYPTAQPPVAQPTAAPALAAPAPPVRAGNGARPAPVAPTWVPEPLPNIVVERGITAADIAAAGPPPPPAAPTPLGPPVVVGHPDAQSMDRLAKTRIVHRAAPTMSAPKESTGSFDLGRSPFGGPSKRPLWIGAGAGVVALAAIAIWAATGSNSETRPPPAPILVKTYAAPPPAIPPPPPETTPIVVAPPPKTVPVNPLPAAVAPPFSRSSRLRRRLPWRSGQ